MKLFAVIVLVLAGAFSVAMLVVFSFILGAKDKSITFTGRLSTFARLIMFLASVANAAIVLLYLHEWNC